MPPKLTPEQKVLAKAAAAARQADQNLIELMVSMNAEGVSFAKIAIATELTEEVVRRRIRKASPYTKDGRLSAIARDKLAAQKARQANEDQFAADLLASQPKDLEPGVITVSEAMRRLSLNRDPVSRSAIREWITQGRIAIQGSTDRPKVVTDEFGRVVVEPFKVSMIEV